MSYTHFVCVSYTQAGHKNLAVLKLELQTVVNHCVGAGDWTKGPLQE